MANTKGMMDAVAKLNSGKGVFYDDPLFVKSDGSIVDKDGTEVYKASNIGLSAYNEFVGFARNVPASATERGGELVIYGGRAKHYARFWHHNSRHRGDKCDRRRISACQRF